MDSKNISPRKEFEAKSKKKAKQADKEKSTRKVLPATGNKITYSKKGLVKNGSDKKNDQATEFFEESKKIIEENIGCDEEGKLIVMDKNKPFSFESKPILSDENETPKTKGVLPFLMDEIIISDKGQKVRITLTKTKNRMVRLQVFYNDVEIRPSTFTGNNPAQNYWDLLKGLKGK